MGFTDDINKAMYSAVQRKIELQKSITIQELYDILKAHESEFAVDFGLHTFPIKRITFKRHPKLELQLIVTVKDRTIKVTPNIQEGTIGVNGMNIRTADLKNGFGFATEFGRDDYVEDVVAKITRMLKEAGY